MNTGKYILFGILVATLIGFTGCSDDDDFSPEVSKTVPLQFSFREDGSLVINASFPNKQQYESEIDGHTWKVISNSIISPDGTLKEYDGHLQEWFYVFNHGRMAMLIEFDFAQRGPELHYESYENYDETTGSNGAMWFVGLSADGNEVNIIQQVSYYPERTAQPTNGYELKVLRKVSEQERNTLYQKYKVDESQLVPVTPFEPSNGADLFGTSIENITYQYMLPGYEVAARGMKQISKSVFDKYVSGYGWKCEETHQIEPDGSINPEDYEYPEGIGSKRSYYFSSNSSCSFYSSASSYETDYVYDETQNKISLETINATLVAPMILVSISDDYKTIWLVKNNLSNDTSSLMNDRYNLMRYVRMTDEELQELLASTH